MARLNIEEQFWMDPRLKILEKKFKNRFKAIGCVCEFWRLAQEHWKHDHSLIPLDIFEAYSFPKALFETGFAEMRENGVYACGSEKQFEWLFSAIKSGKIGGKISAERKRNKNKALSISTPTSEAVAPEHPLSSLLFTPYSLLKEEKNTIASQDFSAEKPTLKINSKWGSVSEKGKQLISTVKESVLVNWSETYRDEEFIISELNRAASWILVNSHKAPKKFDRFFNSWLAKGWEERRKGIPSKNIKDEEESRKAKSRLESLLNSQKGAGTS